MQLKDVAEIQYSIPVATKKKEIVNGRWLNGSGLLENNQTITIDTSYEYDFKSVIQASKEDLLLKRVSPTYVNVYEYEHAANIGTNIIRIRVKEWCDPYFIMLIIESHLKAINEKANNGTRLSAVNRELLGSIEIPNIHLIRQKQIGKWLKLRYKSLALQKELNEKIELKNKLIEKQILLKLKGEN